MSPSHPARRARYSERPQRTEFAKQPAATAATSARGAPARSRRHRDTLARAVPLILAVSVALTAIASPAAAQPVPPTAGLGQEVPGRLLVTMRRDVAPERETRVHASAGGRVVRDLRATALRIVEVAPDRRAEAIRAYGAAPEVLAVEPDRVLSVAEVPDDPMYPQEWGLAQVQAAQAWDVSHSSSVVKIAILDCGIFADHPDIGPKIVLAFDFTGVGNTNDGCDHGTHVAGIAAATANNGIGVAGLGRDAAILNGKVIRNDGTTTEGFVIEGLVWAANNGAQVINLSLAGQVACSLAMQTAVDYAWGTGAVIAAAAGNLGSQGAATPGNCAHVLAVAATDQTDARAAFSNFGPNVALAAPGIGILSTDNTGSYVTKSGTSMATPFVSGLAALVWSTAWGTSNQAVVDRLTLQADPIPGTGTLWQYGRINAARAVGAALPVVDVIQPTILGVLTGGITTTTATVGWATNEPATSQVEYGPTTAYGSATVFDPSLLVLHAQTLTGLAPSTLYHYRVRSTDAAGNLAVSTDATFTTAALPVLDTIPPTATVNQAVGQADPTSVSPLLFSVVFSEPVADFGTGDVLLAGTAGATTALVSGSATDYTVAVSGMTTSGSVTVSVPAGVAHDAAGNPNLASTSTDNTVTFTLPAPVLDTTPPVLNAISASGITSSGATISWATNEASTSQVEYGLTTAYGSTTLLDPTLVTAHAQTLTGLAAATLYHYRVRSTDAAGNLAVSADATFTTAAPPTLTVSNFRVDAVVTGVGAFSAARGTARFEDRGDQRLFRLDLQNVNLPTGTVLDVLVNGARLGSISLVSGSSRLSLDSRNGDQLPLILFGSLIEVRTGAGVLVASGRFG